MTESEKELKSLLMRVNKDSEKAVLASSPLTSWQIEGETVTGFIFLASKIIADSEIKRYFLLGKKNYDKSKQHIKKLRHHFANKVPYSQS